MLGTSTRGLARWIALLACVFAQSASTRPVDDALDLKRLDQELAQIMLTGQSPALVLGMVANGQIVLTRALGVSVVGSKQAIDANTRFRLASISKSVSAVLVGKFVQQGYLAWETPVTLLVPSFRLQDPNSVFLTVEQLLSQRTGLPHHSMDRQMEAASEFSNIRPLLGKIKPACAIGACFAYQNVSYGYAEDLSYAASGQFFANALQRELFEPLGMARANYGHAALSEDDNWARPHHMQWPSWRELKVKPNYYWVGAAAGVNASVSDMQQYLLALLGYKPFIVAPEVIKKISTPQISTPGETLGPLWRRSRLRSASYGLGLRIFDYSGHTIWFHAGAVAGYRGMIVGAPDKNAGLVVLWNSESNLPAGLVPTILDRWFDLPANDWMQISRYMPKPVARGVRRKR